jgi:hypothetical protein
MNEKKKEEEENQRNKKVKGGERKEKMYHFYYFFSVACFFNHLPLLKYTTFLEKYYKIKFKTCIALATGYSQPFQHYLGLYCLSSCLYRTGSHFYSNLVCH